MSKNIFPTTASEINKFKEFKYLEGLPRAYRFNAKNGVLARGADTPLTAKGESFSFIPIAYRLFSAEMFQYESKDWAEIFFVNDSGHISCLMIHGFSVDSLRETMADLFYDGVSLTQVVLTLTPVPKANEHGQYYVANFKATPLPEKDRLIGQMIADALPAPLFQYKTASVNTTQQVSENMPLLGVPGEDTPLIEEA